MSVLLGVNVDHIATIRQARGIRFPDPVLAAQLAEHAGADGITMHLREDARHIQEADVRRAQSSICTRLNFEMAVTEQMVDFACEIQPSYVCLVPEKREELTTEGGLDLFAGAERIAVAIERLRVAGCIVSLFIDPDLAVLEQAVQLNAPFVELHTGEYAEADEKHREGELARIAQAVAHGLALGLQVNAGHGLNYHNTAAIAALPGITELNIGHAIVAQALFTGWSQAVADMKRIIDRASLQASK